MMSKNKKIIGILAGVLVVGLGFLGWYQGYYFNPDKHLYNQIKNRPDLLEEYNKAMADEKRLAENPNQPDYIFDEGLAWKSIGELGGGNDFFQRSLATYEQGIARYGNTNILFYLNGGNVAERLGDLAKAEQYYRKAMELSPGDESGYFDLVELYSYKLKKPEADILQIFNSALEKVVDPTQIIYERGTYLRRIGDNVNALKDYQILVEKFPNRPGYKQIVEELQSKIAAQNSGQTK